MDAHEVREPCLAIPAQATNVAGLPSCEGASGEIENGSGLVVAQSPELEQVESRPDMAAASASVMGSGVNGTGLLSTRAKTVVSVFAIWHNLGESWPYGKKECLEAASLAREHRPAGGKAASIRTSLGRPYRLLLT